MNGFAAAVEVVPAVVVVAAVAPIFRNARLCVVKMRRSDNVATNGRFAASTKIGLAVYSVRKGAMVS